AGRPGRRLGPGALSFALSARGGGRTVSLPRSGRGTLRLHIARAMRRVVVPAFRSGKIRPGTVSLFMPWGTGPFSAGLSPGIESATLGPSSFDVDRRGRIHVLDPLQHRIAVFGHGRLLRTLSTAATPQSD